MTKLNPKQVIKEKIILLLEFVQWKKRFKANQWNKYYPDFLHANKSKFYKCGNVSKNHLK